MKPTDPYAVYVIPMAERGEKNYRYAWNNRKGERQGFAHTFEDATEGMKRERALDKRLVTA